MYVILNFQKKKKTVYIPDGYVHDLREFQKEFLLWMEDQPECVRHNGKSDYCFDEETVLKYINNVVLSDSHEKAYFVSAPIQGHKKALTVSF